MSCVWSLFLLLGQKYLTKQLKATHGWSVQSLMAEMSWREGRGHIAPAGRKQTEEDWCSAHLFLVTQALNSSPSLRYHILRHASPHPASFSFRFGSGPPLMGWCHTHPEWVGLSASVKSFRKHPPRHTHSHSVLPRWF